MRLFYRCHRGSLVDSLSTTVEFESLNNLIAYVANKWKIDIRDVTISYYGYDNRANQDLYIVCFNKRVIGFIYEEKN